MTKEKRMEVLYEDFKSRFENEATLHQMEGTEIGKWKEEDGGEGIFVRFLGVTEQLYYGLEMAMVSICYTTKTILWSNHMDRRMDGLRNVHYRINFKAIRK